MHVGVVVEAEDHAEAEHVTLIAVGQEVVRVPSKYNFLFYADNLYICNWDNRFSYFIVQAGADLPLG